IIYYKFGRGIYIEVVILFFQVCGISRKRLEDRARRVIQPVLKNISTVPGKNIYRVIAYCLQDTSRHRPFTMLKVFVFVSPYLSQVLLFVGIPCNKRLVYRPTKTRIDEKGNDYPGELPRHNIPLYTSLEIAQLAKHQNKGSVCNKL